MLEELLFETVIINKEKDIKLKLPVWSGEFLKKIDLSQVDFTDVSWSMLGVNDIYMNSFFVYRWIRRGVEVDESALFLLEHFRKDNFERYKLANGYIVGYAGTNAKIDLSKSYEAKHEKRLLIQLCNFNGLDFSQQDLSTIETAFVLGSNLGDTKLPIGNVPIVALHSDLSGIDLSNKEINAFNYMCSDKDSFGNCNLTNCGVHIDMDMNEFENRERELQEFQKAMSEKMTGCYLNGVKILSEEEQQVVGEEEREEYEKMINVIFNHNNDDFTEESSNSKRSK